MKTVLSGLFLLTTLTLSAQVKHKNLWGEWQLTAMIGKQIGESEKQKRYVFTSDSLHYFSHRINISGSYSLHPKSGRCEWYIPDRETPLIFYLKYQNNGTMRMREDNKDIEGILTKSR